MRTLIFGLLLFLSTSGLLAQKAPAKFGDVLIEDVKMTKFAPDTSAEAVILVDYGQTAMPYHPREGFQLTFERLTRIKILKKEGLEWANFEIPVYHTTGAEEKVFGLKGITYNLENGKIVETKLKSESVFKEKSDKNWDIMKVTLPNVKVGSVIEITYRITSDFISNLQDWQFQFSVPVLWSEYRVRVPEYYNYDKYAQGYVPFVINEQSQTPQTINFAGPQQTGQSLINENKLDYMEKSFRWAAKDVPAFRSEAFITTPQDYLSKLNFELAYISMPKKPVEHFTSTWADINKTFSESEEFGQQVRGNGSLKKVVDEITVGMSPEQKVGAIFSYVRANVEWDGRMRKFSDNVRKALEDKKGSSADINLLLASMLEKAEIKVSPVLISTRDHGFVRENIAMSTQFNTVICHVTVNDKTVLLDATDRLLPLGMLPARCLNGRGFMISRAGHGWVNLNTSMKSKTLASGDFALTSKGELKGKLQLERTGYHARGGRKVYFEKGEAEYVKEFAGDHQWDIKTSQFTNAKELAEPFKELHEVDINEHITTAGDVMYINPFIAFSVKENPFKTETREYPVDFNYPFDQTFSLKITLPEGYVIDELPESKVFTLPDNGGKYMYNVSQNGNIIAVTSILQINRSLFAQTEYPGLREFYNRLVAKQAEQIILKKKT